MMRNVVGGCGILLEDVEYCWRMRNVDLTYFLLDVDSVYHRSSSASGAQNTPH